ncbi:Protein CBG05345 [Caenorhabditis briggsae]|uniref:Uncharacterized protein n=2 Tax=Caenorhabditis briggsae TaxID=6238 RepID=A0AAE8ZW94_CAEBR|nr:Protein CBG05345 [Caenorhabditis briggsae]ULT84275.1 hypothetical protein L3Y34_013146 [Caenorhabditis briggsae]CAP25838.2 Protein CBG05345 [Caenorhabditis briggsae]
MSDPTYVLAYVSEKREDGFLLCLQDTEATAVISNHPALNHSRLGHLVGCKLVEGKLIDITDNNYTSSHVARKNSLSETMRLFQFYPESTEEMQGCVIAKCVLSGWTTKVFIGPKMLRKVKKLPSSIEVVGWCQFRKGMVYMRLLEEEYHGPEVCQLHRWSLVELGKPAVQWFMENIGTVFQWGRRLLNERSLGQNDVCTMEEIMSMVDDMKPIRKVGPWALDQEAATGDGVFICRDRGQAVFYLSSNKCGIICVDEVRELKKGDMVNVNMMSPITFRPFATITRINHHLNTRWETRMFRGETLFHLDVKFLRRFSCFDGHKGFLVFESPNVQDYVFVKDTVLISGMPNCTHTLLYAIEHGKLGRYTSCWCRYAMNEVPEMLINKELYTERLVHAYAWQIVYIVAPPKDLDNSA